jgi:hypothetical protein
VDNHIDFDFVKQMADALANCWDSVYDDINLENTGLSCETVAFAVAHFFAHIAPVDGVVSPMLMLNYFMKYYLGCVQTRCEEMECGDDG